MTSEIKEDSCTSVEQIIKAALSVEFPVVLHSGFSALNTRYWVHRESELESQAIAAFNASPTGEVTIKKLSRLKVVRETSRRQSG